MRNPLKRLRAQMRQLEQPGPRKKKKKKKRLPVAVVAPAPQPVEEPLSEEMLKIAASISEHTLGYVLRLGGLPGQRVLTEEQKAKVNKTDLKVLKERLSQNQRLFSKHASLTRFNSARTALIETFRRSTYCGPQKGIRVFLCRMPADATKMTVEEIQKHHYDQVHKFELRVEEAVKEYDATIVELQAAWSSVMDQNRADLDDLFKESYYPTAAELPSRLYHEFYPVSVQLPEEYQWASSERRQKLWADSMSRLFAGFNKEMDAVADAMLVQFTHMVRSITAFHAGEKVSFKRTVVDRFFAQLEEIQDKFVKCGIPIEGNLKRFAKGVRGLLKTQGVEAEGLSEHLREDASRRAAFLAEVEKLKPVLEQAYERPRRRRVEVD